MTNNKKLQLANEAIHNRTGKQYSHMQMLEWIGEDYDDCPTGPISSPGPEFASAVHKVIACPAVYVGQMKDGAYFRLRYRGDNLRVGFGWQDYEDIQGVPNYQFGIVGLCGEKYAGSMDWPEAREHVLRFFEEWIAGGCE